MNKNKVFLGGLDLSKWSYILGLTVILLIFLVNGTNANAVDNIDSANWQVNTKKPSSQQLAKLYELTWKKSDEGSISDLHVDDSQVNYKKVGIYPIRFKIGTTEMIETTMIIQTDSPINLYPLPVLQLEVDKNMVLTNELLQSYLASEAKAFKYEILKHTININRIGKYKVKVRITDPFGRSKIANIMAEVVDIQAPVLTIDKNKLKYVLGNHIKAKQIAEDIGLFATDNYSEKLYYEWYLAKLNTDVSGDYKVGVKVTDGSNNSSPIQYITISITEVETLKRLLQYEVNSSIDEVRVMKDLSMKTLEKIAFNKVDFKKTGVYQMPVFLKDNVESTVEIAVVDTTPPTIQTAITSMEYDNAQQVNEYQLIKDFQLKVEDNYDDHIEVGFSKAIDELKISGQHQLVINATDSSGNTAELPVSIKVGQTNQIEEAVAPSTSNTKPPNKKDSITEAVKKSFKPKTIYSSNDNEEIKTEVLQPIKKIADSIQENNKTQKMNSLIILIPIVAVILLIFLVIAIQSRKSLKQLPDVEKRRYIK